MSLTDNELIELEEQRTTAPDVANQSQLHSAAPSASPPDAPSPSLPIPPPPQAASTPPPTIQGSHVEHPLPQPQPPAPKISHQAAPIAPNVAREEQDSYLHPADKFWSLYLKEADTEDKHLVESWKGDTDGILIFTGLFAATVATFVTQTYQLLIPPSNDPSAAILLQVSQQLAGSSNGTSVPAYTAPAIQPPFQPPFYAVWVNTLWFLSLFLSLTGALMATLTQQWTRRYLRGIQYRSAPHIRGPMQVMLRLGVKKYKMRQAATLITAILHASVFIFFAGLVGFALHLHPTVASVLISCVSVLVAAYISLSILPMISTVAPYDTVLTPLFQASPRLGRTLIALALKQARKIGAFLQHLGRDRVPVQLFEATAHDSGKHRSRSREEELLRISGQDSGLPDSHTTYALNRTLTNTDEHHEVESFIDSVAVLLSRSGPNYRSLVNDSTLEIMFKKHLLRDKVWSLIESCTNSARNEMSLTARTKRLRTVLVFIRHEEVREAANLSELIKWSYGSNDYTFSWLGRDQTPSVSFLSHLVHICFRMETEVLDGEIHRYHLFGSYTSAAYGYYGEETDSVAWPLFCLVELVCVIFEFATSDGADDPVAAYRHLWEPILHDAQRYAIEYLENTLRKSENLIVEPIPRTLLSEAGLENLIHPFYAPPARRPPTSEEQLKIDYAFSTYHSLVYALRDVAERASLVPLYGPSPRPNPGSGGSLTQPDDNSAFASLPLGIPRTGSGCVLFGPLTWGDRPRYEYYDLIDTWNASLMDNLGSFGVLRDHERGEGYARIFFVRKANARRFADAWTANPLPAYRVVTAELVDDSEGSTSEDSEGDGVDAGGERGGTGEIDGPGSVHDGRSWVKSCWGPIFSNSAAA